MDAMRIDIKQYRKIVVLTGAGISAGSGIRPFRGPDGLWNDQSLVKYADIDTFKAEPLEVWKFWWTARAAILSAEPNAAHQALAAAEAGLRSGQSFVLITQNIDGLHSRAGNRNVVEYHGNVLRSRCSDPSCGLEPYYDKRVEGRALPRCPLCGAALRPDIVMFGEMIPPPEAKAAKLALRDCDLFIAVGTSGTVHPANSFVYSAAYEGARTVYVNLESLRALDPDSRFGEEYLGKAEEILPKLMGGEK